MWWSIIKVVEGADPPHHLLLGNAAYAGATAKLVELRDDYSKWEQVSRAADFPTDISKTDQSKKVA
jgi:hypothetical protein